MVPTEGSPARLFLTSRLLEVAGVVHGFTTREGGVSRGPLASLNLSVSAGDEPGAVRENFARLSRAAGIAQPFVTVRQVHGDRILGALRGEEGTVLREVFAATEAAVAIAIGNRTSIANPNPTPTANPTPTVIANPNPTATTTPNPTATPNPAPTSNPTPNPTATSDRDADAVLALDPDIPAAVRVADCVPVLLYAPDTGTAAAVHSGWRGARLAIAARSVWALQHAAGADPAQVLAAVGPCIGRCCYEVSPELALLFRDLFGEAVADDPARVTRPHLDLRCCVEAALRSAGVREERIERVGGCTSCEAGLYFSHRRDRGRTGRHLAFAVSRNV